MLVKKFFYNNNPVRVREMASLEVWSVKYQFGKMSIFMVIIDT